MTTTLKQRIFSLSCSATAFDSDRLNRQRRDREESQFCPNDPNCPNDSNNGSGCSELFLNPPPSGDSESLGGAKNPEDTSQTLVELVFETPDLLSETIQELEIWARQFRFPPQTFPNPLNLVFHALESGEFVLGRLLPDFSFPHDSGDAQTISGPLPKTSQNPVSQNRSTRSMPRHDSCSVSRSSSFSQALSQGALKRRVFLQYIILTPEILASFANNPISVYQALLEQQQLPLTFPKTPSISLTLPRSFDAFDRSLIQGLLVYPGQTALLTLLSSLIRSGRICFSSCASPLHLISTLLNLLPVSERLSVSFASELLFRSTVPLLLQGFQKKTASASFPFFPESPGTCLDLEAIMFNSLTDSPESDERSVDSLRRNFYEKDQYWEYFLVRLFQEKNWGFLTEKYQREREREESSFFLFSNASLFEKGTFSSNESISPDESASSKEPPLTASTSPESSGADSTDGDFDSTKRAFSLKSGRLSWPRRKIMTEKLDELGTIWLTEWDAQKSFWASKDVNFSPNLTSPANLNPFENFSSSANPDQTSWRSSSAEDASKPLDIEGKNPSQNRPATPDEPPRSANISQVIDPSQIIDPLKTADSSQPAGASQTAGLSQPTPPLDFSEPPQSIEQPKAAESSQIPKSHDSIESSGTFFSADLPAAPNADSSRPFSPLFKGDSADFWRESSSDTHFPSLSDEMIRKLLDDIARLENRPKDRDLEPPQLTGKSSISDQDAFRLGYEPPLCLMDGAGALISPFQQLYADYPERQSVLIQLDSLIAKFFQKGYLAEENLEHFWENLCRTTDISFQWDVREKYFNLIQNLLTLISSSLNSDDANVFRSDSCSWFKGFFRDNGRSSSYEAEHQCLAVMEILTRFF